MRRRCGRIPGHQGEHGEEMGLPGEDSALQDAGFEIRAVSKRGDRRLDAPGVPFCYERLNGGVMARLRQRSDSKSGIWILDYRDVDGKRYQVSTGTTDEDTAKKFLTRYEERMAQVKLGLLDRIGKLRLPLMSCAPRLKSSGRRP